MITYYVYGLVMPTTDQHDDAYDDGDKDNRDHGSKDLQVEPVWATQLVSVRLCTGTCIWYNCIIFRFFEKKMNRVRFCVRTHQWGQVTQ